MIGDDKAPEDESVRWLGLASALFFAACPLLAGCGSEECDGGSCSTASDGWDAAPGSGPIFVVHRLGVRERGEGFDLDAACRATDDCIDNQLGLLSVANDDIQAYVDRSARALLLELAGLDPEFAGNDGAVTLKLYEGLDADQPPDPSNNFGPDDGCCRFSISADSLSDGQARSRSRVSISGYDLESTEEASLAVAVGDADAGRLELKLELAQVVLQLSSDLARIDNGRLGGVLPISFLANASNPFCADPSGDLCSSDTQSLVDVIAEQIDPDIDLPPADGLERLEVDTRSHRVFRCLDGNGQVVEAPVVEEPWSCALDERMSDGYSITLGFSARRAQVDGPSTP